MDRHQTRTPDPHDQHPRLGAGCKRNRVESTGKKFSQMHSSHTGSSLLPDHDRYFLAGSLQPSTQALEVILTHSPAVGPHDDVRLTQATSDDLTRRGPPPTSQGGRSRHRERPRGGVQERDRSPLDTELESARTKAQDHRIWPIWGNCFRTCSIACLIISSPRCVFASTLSTKTGWVLLARISPHPSSNSTRAPSTSITV